MNCRLKFTAPVVTTPPISFPPHTSSCPSLLTILHATHGNPMSPSDGSAIVQVQTRIHGGWRLWLHDKAWKVRMCRRPLSLEQVCMWFRGPMNTWRRSMWTKAVLLNPHKYSYITTSWVICTMKWTTVIVDGITWFPWIQIIHLNSKESHCQQDFSDSSPLSAPAGADLSVL